MDTGTCRVMRTWHDFLDSLDSDGGKIMILLCLMFVGVVCHGYAIPKAEDIIVGAFGALLMALKDSGSNKDRREGDPMPLPTNAGAAPIPVPVPVPVPAPVSMAAPIVNAVGDAADKVVDAIEKDDK